MLLASTLLLSLAAAQGASAQDTSDTPDASVAAERDELAKRVNALEAQVAELSHAAGADAGAAASAKAQEPPPEGFVRIANSDVVLKVGGWVQLDVIHDAYEIANLYEFQTRGISVPEVREPQTTFSVRQTRLYADARTATSAGEARAYFEGDFFDSDTQFRIRHAYGEWSGLLAGQTWSNFMDISSRPSTLDYEGPDAEVFVRQPMIRWNQKLGGGHWSWSTALEGATVSFTTTGAVMGASEQKFPDLTSHVRLEGDGRHVQLGGIVRSLDFEGSGGTSDADTVGWGLVLSSRVAVGAKDALMGQVSYGEGTSSYVEAFQTTGSDAVVMADGSMDALPVFGAVFGLEHQWSQRWNSTLALSYASIDTIDAQASDAIEAISTASVNAVWQPVTSLFTGVEYMYGTRENRDDQSGFDHRVQFSFRFVF